MLNLLETNARCSGPPINRRNENYRLFCARRDFLLWIPDCSPRHTEILKLRIKHIEQQIAEQNIWMVINIIKSCFHPNEDIDLGTCLDCGIEGMMRAIRKFDISRGIAFSTFAYPSIRVRISRAFRNYTKHHIQKENASVDILNRAMISPENADDSLSKTEAEKWGKDLNSILTPHLDILTEKEQLLLRLRYWDDLSLENIGRRLGVNRQNVKQKIDRLLKKLATRVDPAVRLELFS